MARGLLVQHYQRNVKKIAVVSRLNSYIGLLFNYRDMLFIYVYLVIAIMGVKDALTYEVVQFRLTPWSKCSA